MRTITRLVAVMALAGTSGGCALLTPFAVIGEHKERIAPEFDKLAGRRSAILVWADAATLFDYPMARFELATYIHDKLRDEMRSRELGIDLIDTRDVEDYIQQNPGAQVDPGMVGRNFKTDFVIYIELVEMQIRDPDQPQLLQGRIQALVQVHDLRADPDVTNQYELTPVTIVYPERGPVMINATNSLNIRRMLYHKSAETIARKFYEHTIDM